eukprot:3070056-Amphidinium_carterae.1
MPAPADAVSGCATKPEGKIVYVSTKVKDCGVDTACFQETRLCDQLKLTKTGGHSIFSTPALRLIATVNGVTLHVINCHAPIIEASDTDHEDLAVQLELAVNLIRHLGHIVICCDLNAKLKGLNYSIIGPMALSTCPHGGRDDNLEL